VKGDRLVNDDLTKKLPSSTAQRRKASLTIMQTLESRFEALEKKVEERLYDTRPIWEKVLGDVAQLQEGQVRLEEGHARLEESHARLEEGHARLEEGHARLEEGHARLEKNQARLQESQARLEEGHARLQESQARLEGGQARLEEGQEFLRGEMREIKTLLRDIFRRLSIFNDTLVTMQADYRDIYDRVRGLELNRN
jgi:chromosome segregation ATPase